MFKNTQSGRSMIEMLGVLAIIGVLSAGGIAGYSMAMKSYKTNKVSESLQTIAQQVQTIYNGNYTNVNASDLAALGVDLANPFGGNFVLAADTTSNNARFTVSASNVEKSACIKLATSKPQWGTMVTNIKVGETEVANSSTNGTLSSASTACASEDNNTVIFTFK